MEGKTASRGLIIGVLMLAGCSHMTMVIGSAAAPCPLLAQAPAQAMLYSDGEYWKFSWSQDAIKVIAHGVAKIQDLSGASHDAGVKNLEIDPKHVVDATARAPRADAIIVLETDDVSSTRSPRDFLVKSFGWQIYYYDVFLSVYDLAGKKRCEIEIAHQLPQAIGYVTWTSGN